MAESRAFHGQTSATISKAKEQYRKYVAFQVLVFFEALQVSYKYCNFEVDGRPVLTITIHEPTHLTF